MKEQHINDWNFEIKATFKGRPSARDLLYLQGYTMAIKKNNLIINKKWMDKTKIICFTVVAALMAYFVFYSELEPVVKFSGIISIIFSGYMILAYCINNTIIFVSKERIKKVVRPLPISLDIRIPVKNIVKINSEKASENKGELNRVIKLYLNNMDMVRLAFVYGDEEAKHLQTNIENFLSK